MGKELKKITILTILVTLMCTLLINVVLYLIGEDLTSFWKMYLIMPLIGLGALLISFITIELIERL